MSDALMNKIWKRVRSSEFLALRKTTVTFWNTTWIQVRNTIWIQVVNVIKYRRDDRSNFCHPGWARNVLLCKSILIADGLTSGLDSMSSTLAICSKRIATLYCWSARDHAILYVLKALLLKWLIYSSVTRLNSQANVKSLVREISAVRVEHCH